MTKPYRIPKHECVTFNNPNYFKSIHRITNAIARHMDSEVRVPMGGHYNNWVIAQNIRDRSHSVKNILTERDRD